METKFIKRIVLILSLTFAGLLFIAAFPLTNYFGDAEEETKTIASADSLPDKHMQKEFNVKFGGRLTIDLRTGGMIEIEGWDKEVVDAQITIEGSDAEDVQLELEQNGNDVEIISFYDGDMENGYHANTNIVVKIPNKYDIDFSTMGGGVKLDNLNGVLSGRTMGGELNLSHLRGMLNVSTMGGNITVKDCEVDGEVQTMGGEVRVENVTGDLNAKTMGGKVKQVNVKSKKGNEGDEVNISTMGGDIEVDEAMNGTKVRTMGGDITVNKAAKFVDAETYGGDIKIHSIDGSVSAETKGGDVSVNMAGDPNEGDRFVYITSFGGDIVLSVPSGLSMDIDIEIAFTKDKWRKNGDVKIISDFDIAQKTTDEWDDSKGSSRKYLRGKGEINGGKHKIKIRTINGNVTLKKS